MKILILHLKQLLILLTLGLLIAACSNRKDADSGKTISTIPRISITFVKEYPHDRRSFTEGFFFHDGKLFESTGATDLPETRSLYGIVDLNTGAIDVKAELDRNKYFGEGIALLNDKLYQLTYKSKVGFVYDASTFEQLDKFTIPSAEGWGLTTDGQFLIMSDGTSKLSYIDPHSLTVSKSIFVKENGSLVQYLNELEYIEGFIYANVWQTNRIVKIDPKDGSVVGQLDLSIYAFDAKSIYQQSMEMNGIAYNPDSKTLFFTGKLWPKIYEIKLPI